MAMQALNGLLGTGHPRTHLPTLTTLSLLPTSPHLVTSNVSVLKHEPLPLMAHALTPIHLVALTPDLIPRETLPAFHHLLLTIYSPVPRVAKAPKMTILVLVFIS
jgi:hypothetical protein